MYQQNKKTKPLKRPVVAFYDIEAEIYTKAKRQADDHTPEDPSEDEDDNPNDDKNPADEDGEFELDNDIDLSSPFLHNMLSDKQLVPDLEDVMTPTSTMYPEWRDREPTEEEWENA